MDAPTPNESSDKKKDEVDRGYLGMKKNWIDELAKQQEIRGLPISDPEGERTCRGVSGAEFKKGM